MPEDAKRFVLVAIRDDGTELFMAIDHTSGGYPYWRGEIDSTSFKTREELDAVLTNPEFAKSRGDGWPGVLLHSGSGANYDTPRREVRIEVWRVTFDVVSSVHHTVVIPEKK
jgi:hypothetical protein